jgi:hypothetical protein
MEHTLNIVDYKVELDSLTTKLISEYTKLENSYITNKLHSVNSLNDISSKNKSMCDLHESHMERINELKNELHTYKLNEKTYKSKISELEESLKNNCGNDDTVNKFDMVRSQAKEISAKDNEIIRLTKELEKLKETKHTEMKRSQTKHTETVTTSSQTSGWSPTTSNTPLQSNIEAIDLNNESTSESEEFTIITYRTNKYYKGVDDKVYNIENGEVGKYIGSYLKQVNGKFKLIRV